MVQQVVCNYIFRDMIRDPYFCCFSLPRQVFLKFHLFSPFLSRRSYLPGPVALYCLPKSRQSKYRLTNFFLYRRDLTRTWQKSTRYRHRLLLARVSLSRPGSSPVSSPGGPPARGRGCGRSSRTRKQATRRRSRLLTSYASEGKEKNLRSIIRIGTSLCQLPLQIK